MSNLYLTIGILGSGKSTWAKQFVKENPNTKIVNADGLRTMFHGEYRYVRALDKLITLVMQQCIQGLLLVGYDVIVDVCNNDRTRRLSWLGAASFDRTIKKIAVVFPLLDKQWHIDNASKNSRGLGKDYWEGIYDLHVKQFEQAAHQDFDEVWTVDKDFNLTRPGI